MEELLNKQYAYLIDKIFNSNKKAKYNLLKLAIEPKEIFNIPEPLLRELLISEEIEKINNAKYINIEESWKQLEKMDIKFTYYGAGDYPVKLLDIPDPPFGLYYRGSLPNPDIHSVAMIGARQNSEYGRVMACEFARAFARQGVNVISGMALGIDGISQREAISNGGQSYAVLGCGVDVVYPQSNRALYNSLLVNGGIISEYLPNTAALGCLFPPRNRIISGLSDCVLVIEAREKSGTLITVDMALEQGRDVFVVPGRCTDSLSIGCNKLMRTGAIPVCTPEDLLFDMKWIVEENSKKRKAKTILLSDNAKIILKYLDYNWKTVDDILQELKRKNKKVTMSELLSGLTELEIKGIVQKSFGQYSVKVSGF